MWARRVVEFVRVPFLEIFDCRKTGAHFRKQLPTSIAGTKLETSEVTDGDAFRPPCGFSACLFEHLLADYSTQYLTAYVREQ